MVQVVSAATAVAAIPAGSCVAVGGSVNAGHPMALVRAIIRARIGDLTVAGLTSGFDIDMLVAAGCVSTLSAAYVGADDVAGLPPATRWMAETGRTTVFEYSEGVHLAGLRAQAQRQPYATWTGSLGSSVTNHPKVEKAFDETSGMHYLKVRPIGIDVALLWAEAADEEGNILMWGTDLGDEPLRNAAPLRIVQVERVVPTSYLARFPDRVVPWAADVVVCEPWGTHPFASSSIRPDEEWLREYVAVVTAARQRDDHTMLDTWLDRWIRHPVDEHAYMERIGVRRLRELVL